MSPDTDAAIYAAAYAATTRRHWVTWAVLVVATISSLVVSLELGDERATVATIIAVAAVKAVLVLWDFMELRQCHRATQLALFAWPPLVIALVLGLYLTQVA